MRFKAHRQGFFIFLAQCEVSEQRGIAGNWYSLR
jgi:hypothetical protein